jgi:hypothetical protein
MHTRVLVVLSIGAASMLSSSTIAARAQTDSVARRPVMAPLCWRGKPLPACGWFWLTEVSGEYAYASTERHYRQYGTVVNAYDRPDVTSRVIWTIGPMFNTASGHASGATLSAGFVNDGSRIALEGRRRWWGDNAGAHPTFDLSAGLVRLNVPPPPNGFATSAHGVTIGGYLVGGDLVQLNLRGDLLLTGGQVRGGGTVGAGLGSYAATGATVLAAALLGVAIVALAHAQWD